CCRARTSSRTRSASCRRSPRATARRRWPRSAAGRCRLWVAGGRGARRVAGIAMCLIKEGDRFAVLSDILGDEDHLGDMDFKVAGTEKGITALQMDIKIESIGKGIMKIALDQAREARLGILQIMKGGIEGSRTELSTFAPRIIKIKI